MGYDPGDYTMQRTSTALKGAQAGAALGSAIVPGWGTVGGALLGGAGGFLMGGPSEAQTMRDDYLKKIYHDMEMGLLGLSDAERRQLEANLVDPVLAQERQNRDVWAAQQAMTGLSAGDVMRMQSLQNAAAVQNRMAAQKQINAINTEMALAQKQALQEMMAEKVKEQAKVKADILQEVINLGGVAATAGTEFAEMKDIKAQEAAMGLGGADIERANRTAAAKATAEKRADRIRQNIATQWGLPPDATKEELEKIVAINEQMGINNRQTRMARNLLEHGQYSMTHANDGTDTYNPYAGVMGDVWAPSAARQLELQTLGWLPDQEVPWEPPGVSGRDMAWVPGYGDQYK